jgi:predicted Zn finger-like uncharacterized protein
MEGAFFRKPIQPMLTRCPECNTTFRVTVEQLAMADGRVRCGRCSAIFDARRAIADEDDASSADEAGTAVTPRYTYVPDYSEFLAPVPAVAAPENSAPDAVPEPDNAADRDTGPPDTPPTLAPKEVEPSPDAAANATVESAPREPVPDVLADDLQALTRKRSVAKALAWATLIVALALLLGAQLTYVMRDDLARYPTVRPWLVRMCDLLGCAPPLHQELTRLRVLSSQINPEPGHPDVLSVRVTMVNTADYPQPYPLLQLRLSDIEGRVVGMRRFRPSEYLPAGTDVRAGMAAQTPVSVHLRLVNPGSGVTSYQFDFR